MREEKKPKKAKLITFGGFYKIIDLPEFKLKILYPFTTKFEVIASEFAMDEWIVHHLIFIYSRTRRGYAEYRQVDYVKINSSLEKKVA